MTLKTPLSVEESSTPICDVRIVLPDWDWKPLAHGECGYSMISDPEGVEDMVGQVLSVTGGKAGVTLASRLVPGQVIPTHTDHHDNNCTRRVHVPLKTNPRAFFLTQDGQFHMELGKAYVINPAMPHGVVNEGEEDRIHLMFNVVG